MFELIALFSFTGIVFFLGMALFRLFVKVDIGEVQEGKRSRRKKKVSHSRMKVVKRHFRYSFISLIVFILSVIQIITKG